MDVNESQLEEIERIATLLALKRGALIEVLHAVQDKFGYIPKESIETIAKVLNLSAAQVYGVITFYHYFRETAPGQHIIKICKAESCQAMGALALLAHVEEFVDSQNGYVNVNSKGANSQEGNAKITLEEVYCLGNCAASPSLLIDDRIFGRVDTQTFDQITVSMGL